MADGAAAILCGNELVSLLSSDAVGLFELSRKTGRAILRMAFSPALLVHFVILVVGLTTTFQTLGIETIRRLLVCAKQIGSKVLEAARASFKAAFGI